MTPSWPHTLVVAATFAIVILTAGHSDTPLGLLLSIGFHRQWLEPVPLGWIAITALILGRAWGSGHDLRVLRAAGILCGCSWVLFLSKSDAKFLTVVLSLPFLALLATWLHRTWPHGTGSGG
jgi:hypothetical protein